MKEKIFHTNCSEMCFILTGTLDEIKSSIFSMLDVVKKEDKFHLKRVEKARELIKECKSLDDIEKVIFEFTCNYETHFKKDGNNLKVATCNNYDWDDMGQIHMEEEDYYKISGKVYCKIILEYKDYMILRERWGDNKINKGIIKLNKKLKSKIVKNKELILYERGKNLFVGDDSKMVKVEEVEVEDLPSEMKTEIVLRELKK